MEVILEYRGEIGFDTIDLLLSKLKNLPAYKQIKRSVQRKLYCVFAECLDNLFKHRITDSVSINDERIMPYIVLASEGNAYTINTGNLVVVDSIQDLSDKFERVNQQDSQVAGGCARCHVHPEESWTPRDNLALGAFQQRMAEQLHLPQELKLQTQI